MKAEKEIPTDQLTYRCELMRAPFAGMLEAGWMTFGLLIAIRVFHAPDEWKAAISSAGFFGLLLNSFFLALFARTGLGVTHLICGIMLAAGCLLIGSAFATGLGLFLLFMLSAHVIVAQHMPLMIDVYTQNFSARERGSKLGSVFILSGIGGIIFSYLGGRLLDFELGYYPLILLAMAGGLFVSAALIRRIPSRPLQIAEAGNPFKSISLIWKDGLFGGMLTAWMLLGFANLMMLPLRVEYVANPKYGINLSNEAIAVLTIVVPSVLRLASTRAWGTLFDRMHFTVWRNCVNFCLLASILIYFNSHSLPWLLLGAALEGLGRGGGQLGWNLWVTKIAPVEKVSAYMSVHTGLTGLRGCLAPFIGFTLLMGSNPSLTSLIASGIMVLSILLFILLGRSPRFMSDA